VCVQYAKIYDDNKIYVTIIFNTSIPPFEGSNVPLIIPVQLFSTPL
jgi:hypothetical protein